MYFKSDITSWKDPNTNEFVTRKEYSMLSKRAGVNGVSTSEYLISIGYFQDKYHYYRLKAKLSLSKDQLIAQIILGQQEELKEIMLSQMSEWTDRVITDIDELTIGEIKGWLIDYQKEIEYAKLTGK
jgi:hypothetical protein